MGIQIGEQVTHVKFGVGEVESLDLNAKFTVRFYKRTRISFYLMDFDKYFVSQKDPLLRKYDIDNELDSESRVLLEKFNGGDFAVSIDLINKLDAYSESKAVNAICEKLESLGFPMDFFLLTKRAKALRRIGKKSEVAVDVSTRALDLAKTKIETSIALTARAAAYADIEDLADAERDGKAALLAKPDSFHAYRVLGRVAVKRGNYADADHSFKEAEALDSSVDKYQWTQYVGRVRELRDKGQFSEIEQIKTHIQLNWPKSMAERALVEIAKILKGN
jgi:tetratricopeptide (TPR) repeat protein